VWIFDHLVFTGHNLVDHDDATERFSLAPDKTWKRVGERMSTMKRRGEG